MLLTRQRFRRLPWRPVVLALSCLLLLAARHRDRAALAVFHDHLLEVGQSGGGVLFIVSPTDCITNADQVRRHLAPALANDGLAVKGLLVADGLAAADRHRVLEVVRSYFPHETIALRSVIPIIRHTGTPVALTVDANGRIERIEVVTARGLTRL